MLGGKEARVAGDRPAGDGFVNVEDGALRAAVHHIGDHGGKRQWSVDIKACGAIKQKSSAGAPAGALTFPTLG
jgi:hypothetical protein